MFKLMNAFVAKRDGKQLLKKYLSNIFELIKQIPNFLRRLVSHLGIIYALVVLTLTFFAFRASAANKFFVVPSMINTCIPCHGPKGVSTNSIWPNLAGQKKNYLAKQLKDFKNEVRKDPLMSPIANTLSDQDIEMLADYYSKL